MAEIEAIEPTTKRRFLNPLLANIELASKIDEYYSNEITEESSKVNANLDIQRKLLELKALIPVDVPPHSEPALSPEALKIINDLKSTSGIDLSNKNIKDLKNQVDTNSDRLKLEVDQLFRKIQMCFSDRTQILDLAKGSLHNDPTATMVRNQRV